MTKSSILKPRENDIKMMVLAECHISTKKIDSGMKNYVYGKAAEGLNEQYVGCCLINLQSTWDKIVLSARCIASIEDPKTIYCVGQRTYAQRAIIKFAKEIGATASPGRFTPGQFKNQMTKSFVEPRLLVVADPRTDSQAVKEASYVNIPVIAFCGADSKLSFIDIAIPGNNRGRESIGLLYWLLAREVKRIKAEIPRVDIGSDSWAQTVPVDLFFHKDIKEIEKEAAEQAERDKEEQEAAYENGHEQEFSNESGQNEKKVQDEWDQQSVEDEWDTPPASQTNVNDDWISPTIQEFQKFPQGDSWDQHEVVQTIEEKKLHEVGEEYEKTEGYDSLREGLDEWDK